VAKQLQVFARTDQRPQAVMMKAVAHDLTARDIGDIAAYIEAM
jgi:cytochrome c553